MVKRQLWESAPFSTPTLSITISTLLILGTSWNLGVITLRRLDVRGWRVTNMTGLHHYLSNSNRVRLEIDAVDAWHELEIDLLRATSNVYLQLFYYDIEHVFLRFDPDPPPVIPPSGTGIPTIGIRLEDLLLTLNRRPASVVVRLLIRDATVPGSSIPLPYPVVTAGPVQNYFTSRTGHTIEVRRYPTDIRIPMHAKCVVVDSLAAHIIGSPLLQEYFDGPDHKINDPRRGPMVHTLLPSVSFTVHGPMGLTWTSTNNFTRAGDIRVPIHDVGLAIEGPAVDFIKEVFLMHWNRVGTAPPSTTPAAPAASPNAPVQIVRTLPADTFTGLPNGETGVLEAYQRAFAEATRSPAANPFVYLENQYFTEPAIADAIKLAMAAKPNLEVIMLINCKVDLPGYSIWQAHRINEIRRSLQEIGAQNRFGVFTRWTHDTLVSPSRIIRNYIHSKVAIVNNEWATVGSANLDGVSLVRGEFLAPWETEKQRSTEVNALIFNGVDGLPPSTLPDELRRRLWAEHLGFSSITDPALTTPTTGGRRTWLDLWNAKADELLNALKASPPAASPSRILKWINESDADAYLRALGVDTNPARLGVVGHSGSFDFTTSKWIAKEY
ncbi:MAG: phospholipase D-like domain-containing protein [Anaerolineales bacterium]